MAREAESTRGVYFRGPCGNKGILAERYIAYPFFHKTEEAARAHADLLRLRRIKALRRQIDILEKQECLTKD